MLADVIKMRQLIERPLWWAQIASMATDSDGDIMVDDILAVAAYSVTDEEGALEISMAVQDAVEAVTATHFLLDGPQELTLALLDHVINRHAKMN